MIETTIITWLDFPFWLSIPATSLFWLGTAVGLWWLFQHCRLRPFWHSCLGVVAPFFGSVGVLFGVSVGFMGADIWQRAERAQQAVIQEASALNSLAYLASALGPIGQPVTAAVCTYAKAVVEQEWPEMLLNREASSDTEAILDHIMRPLITPEFTAQVDAILRRELLSTFNQVRQYRAHRIQISSGHSHVGKWVMLLFLGLMTQIAVCVVHLDKGRAQALALSVFTVAMTGAFILLAGMDEPFNPPFAVSHIPIAELASCH